MAKCYVCGVGLDKHNTASNEGGWVGDVHNKCNECAGCICGGTGYIVNIVTRSRKAINPEYNQTTAKHLPKLIDIEYEDRETVRCDSCLVRILKRNSGLLPGEWDRAILANLSPEYGRDSVALIQGIKATIEYAKPNKWLALIGTPGNGKTSALHIITRAYIERGVKAKYYTLPDLISYLQSGYADNEYEQRLKTVLDYPVLSIDELDKVNGDRATENQRQQIFKLLDTRYRYAGESRPVRITAIAGNDLPADPYLRSRLLDNRYITVFNESSDVRLENKSGGW